MNKKVLQFTIDGVFLRELKSLTTIEKELGISRSGIARCCNNIFKQCKGYKWKWK